MSPPALLLDLLALQSQFHGERGTARYVACHTRALLARPGLVRRLFLNPAARQPVRLDPLLRASPLLRWNTAAEMDEALAEGPAAYYVMSPWESDGALCSGYIPARVPLIATVYDLIPLLFPRLYLENPVQRAFFMNRVALLKRADLLLAISESARNDAIAVLGVPPGRVATIGGGVAPGFRPAEAGAPRPREPFASLGLHGPYVMAVLGGEQRKNLIALLEAMAMLPASLQRDLKLVVVGSYGAEGQKVARETRAGRALGERLVFSGVISDECLVALYQRAALHVFPSLYEGFGLPAAEAAACGCPSLTSNTSSLPEVLETPEATFDPHAPDQIASLMTRVLTDSAFRDRLVRRGLEISRKHTWERVAARTDAALAAAGVSLQRRTRLRRPDRPRVALVGPLPPAQSGVADYNERICAALQHRCRLDVFTSCAESGIPRALGRTRCLPASYLREYIDPSRYDAVLYAFGSSGHHCETLDICRDHPGWVWLHDVRLYGLLAARAQAIPPTAEGALSLPEEVRRQYGRRAPHWPPGMSGNAGADAHFLRERDLGLCGAVTTRARGIILHSAHAARLLRLDLAPGQALPPVRIIPLAFPHVAPDLVRHFSTPPVIAHFGIVDAIKHPGLLIRAFAAANGAARLVFVGPVHDTDRQALLGLAAALHVEDRVTFTGRLAPGEYAAWLARAHVAVQLRTLSNGESSAAIGDALAAGTPVITNLPATSDWPSGTVTQLPFAVDIGPLRDAIEELLDPVRLARQSAAGLDFARRNSAERVADQLLAEVLGRPATP